MRKAIFLDRDGTIIEEVNYLKKIDQVCLLPGVPEAVQKLNKEGWLVVVVTNQSGVARGFLTSDQVNEIHEYIDKLLIEHHAIIDAWYFCPYHPDAVIEEFKLDSFDRKPNPGMLLKAAQEWDIDLKKSVIVGDKNSDIKAGITAGCQAYLVLTGYGKNEQINETDNVTVAKNLADVVNILLE